MEDIKTDVIQESSPVVADVQQAQPVEGQIQEQVVSTEAIPEQGNAPSAEELTQKNEVNWKNRAMEYERKFHETVENIPRVIQETLAQSKQVQTKQEPEYTTADLKAFLDSTDDVANRKWAYAEIDRLESEKISRAVESISRKKEEQLEAVNVRKSVENEVINDPRFSGAFIDVGGRKQWNFESPLTQAASQYMKDPALANRPDGMRIAMKLAYADYATSNVGSVAKKLEATKIENTKLKQSTLADGGGVNNVRPAVNPVQQAQIDLAKTGSKTALRTLTQHILKAQGLI